MVLKCFEYFSVLDSWNRKVHTSNQPSYCPAMNPFIRLALYRFRGPAVALRLASQIASEWLKFVHCLIFFYLAWDSYPAIRLAIPEGEINHRCCFCSSCASRC